MTDTIAKDKVVSLQYRLTDDAGQELDSSHEGEPLLYLHGHHNIVPGLEEALEGKTIGDELDVVVPPEKGYGERVAKPQKFPRSSFPEGMELKPGMQVTGQDAEGRPFPMWIAKVQGKQITLDPNHPLAGVTLNFHVKVEAMRDATDDEKAHGHAHGPDGHHHHH